ncbi:MAG: hypothetical protein Q8L92_18350, partial [Rubrivivax sp.]|nr:hypothetical protein [Rubrivivax sp.]
PGNSAGRGNSQHASEPAAAGATATAKPIETGVAPGNSAGHGNSQHASEPASVEAAATDLAEPVIMSGNGVGHGTEPLASNSASAIAMATTEPIETGVAPGNSPGQGNSKHASKSAALNASETAQLAEAASETGGAGQELAFRFNNLASPSTPTPTAAVELEVLNFSSVRLGHDVELTAILEVGTAAVDEHAATTGLDHVKPHLPHELLI